MATEKRLDLIDRKDLIKALEKKHFSLANNTHPYEAIRIQGKYFREVVDNATTVEAEEVVHGRWCWEGKFKACSQCGSYVEWDETLGASFWKFCPYCGAKMDGEGNG